MNAGLPLEANFVYIKKRKNSFMIHKAKDLSPGQKAAIEDLLGRAIAEDEEISVSALAPAVPPDWLKDSWESAERQGIDQLSVDDIDTEIAAARKALRERRTADR